MRGVALGLILLTTLSGMARAEDLPAATDRILWCGSAFYWLSTDAYDSGNEAEGDQYEAWSEDLAARADMMLAADGKDEATITAIRDDYDSRVVGELGQPTAKYDVMMCPDLVAR